MLPIVGCMKMTVWGKKIFCFLSKVFLNSFTQIFFFLSFFLCCPWLGVFIKQLSLGSSNLILLPFFPSLSLPLYFLFFLYMFFLLLPFFFFPSLPHPPTFFQVYISILEHVHTNNLICIIYQVHTILTKNNTNSKYYIMYSTCNLYPYSSHPFWSF